MNKNLKEEDKRFSIKVQLYIMSLWLLFVLIFMLTVDIPISFAQDAEFIGMRSLVSRNILPIISMIMVVWGCFLAKRMQYKWKGATNPPYEIKSIKSENYEYLTFLTTYIIPLICIDLSNVRYIIVLAVLLILIGFIFIKMDLYYGNPTLALLGYRLYRVKIDNINNPDGIVVISKDKLATGMSIEWIKIDETIWVVKENK